ncbi:SpoIID/LytB domain-containing protein [Cystobacter fuscus]|uniref:SpoIID/LytB domain-containing protein n=1 Tax=Cystobacter fuscus TaxID=43 RepID=UPI002B31949E|nr:SpoIID/LytB domain-containing protein [Cystobacter fuscus]
MPLGLLLVLAVAGGTPGPGTRLAERAEALLPDEDDAAAVMDLATGELVLAHHPAVLTRAFPPGSVLKLASAYAALDTHRLPEEPLRCSGRAEIGGRERTCWLHSGHGRIELTRALALSCNIYFHALGDVLEGEELLRALRDFGLGRPTGALPGEEGGVLPQALSREDRIRVAAGDSERVQVTPLQLLQMAAVVAGRGQARSLGGRQGPRLGNLAAVEVLREAMRQAAESGTLAATRLGTLEGAGKTGTARWDKGWHTHGWFIGFAPFRAPRFAVVAFAREGRGAHQAAQPGTELLSLALGGDAPETTPWERPPGHLRVRVLEKLGPVRVRVMTEGGRLRCDGKTLELTGATAEIDQGLLDLGRPDRRCRELYAPGEGVGVRLGNTTRRYRGALRATVLDGQIALFNELSVEDYLRGVVGSELAGKPEALKAQAVVSRTYALAGRNRHERAGYDVCDLTHCQLYRGREDERAEVDKAVEATRGRVLRGRQAREPLAPAYFHSSCGGATSTAASVFGASEASSAVADRVGTSGPLCAGSPHHRWHFEVSRQELARALGIAAEGPAFEVLREDNGGRALEVRTFGVRLSGEAFHARVGRALGYQTLKSLAVSAREVGGKVRFEGRGLGHGVGLCQYGATELERRGYGYEKILKHYFPERTLGEPPL